MFRPLLTFFLLFPVVLLAQDTTTCSQLTIDLDGDLQIGEGDILMLLGGYGTNLDLDGDMIPDCQDDCVGVYDECGVCNGPGPQHKREEEAKRKQTKKQKSKRQNGKTRAHKREEKAKHKQTKKQKGKKAKPGHTSGRMKQNK